MCPKGQADTGFGGDGKVATNFTSGRDFAAGVAIQADERIVAAGTANFGGDARFAPARYNPDGTLDTGFSGDGKVTTTSPVETTTRTTWGSNPPRGRSWQRERGTRPETIPRSALARYNTDGTLDTGFSADGNVTTNFTGGADFAVRLAIQPVDRKIVCAGRAGGTGGRFALARYFTD